MSELTQALLDAIATAPDRRIPFSTFMQQALYTPHRGYYWQPKIGGAGQDFFPAVSHGPDFGELLAEQFVQMWQILGQPQPFHLVEMGPGQGLLAADVLGHLQQQYPDCLAAVEYFLVEASDGLIAQQQARLADWAVPIHWTTLADLPPIVGCAFSNEFVDALPVHRVEICEGELWEVFVCDLKPTQKTPHRLALSEAQPNDSETSQPKTPFAEVLGLPSNPHLVEYFQRLNIDLTQYPNGYRTEVNLAALDWLSQISKKLRQGYLFTIDYGYPAQRYYNPRREGGTLQCYYQHRHHSNPYVNVGSQDITAHVDFTTLEKVGESLGLKTVGFTQQAMFLMSLGLGERMAGLSQTTGTDLNALLQRRDALRQLIDPMGMGNFGVLMQSQGLTAAQQRLTPQGFVVPAMA